MTLDLRKLRHVVMTANTGSVSAAANILSITQPALTRSIADVERLTGIVLFQRLPRGVQLTEEGKLFCTKAQRVLSESEDLEREVEDCNELRSGSVRIGVVPPTYADKIGAVIGSFAESSPELRLKVLSGTAEDMVPKLFSGQLDILVGYGHLLEPWLELQIQQLSKLDCLFLMRKDHPLANKEHVTTADVLAFPSVLSAAFTPSSTNLARLYRHHNVKTFTARYSCTDFEMAKQIIKSTDAYAITHQLPGQYDALRDEFFVFDAIEGYIAPWLSLGILPDQPLGQAAMHFIDVTRAHFGCET